MKCAICVEGARFLGAHAHPEVSLHTHSLADYVDRLDRGDRSGVAELMLSSARKLASAGADFLICPDNTIHQAMGHVLPLSPLPWLHIAEVVADEAVVRGFKRIGIPRGSANPQHVQDNLCSFWIVLVPTIIQCLSRSGQCN